MGDNNSVNTTTSVQLDPFAIAQRIRPAMTSLYVTYFRHAHHSDLSGPQLSLLMRLQAAGSCRISHIAEAEGVRMPTASNTINQLEKRGLVKRVRDISDRRGVSVELTQEGADELARVGDERTKYLGEMLAVLPEVDRHRLNDLADVINKLADNYVNYHHPQPNSGSAD